MGVSTPENAARRVIPAQRKDNKLSIDTNDDFFETDWSSQEPALDEAGEKKAQSAADATRTQRIVEAKQRRNSAFQSFLKAKPEFQLDRDIDDNAILLIETITGTRLKTHSRDASQIVAFDRKDGAAVPISEVMERFYHDLPTFRSEVAQELIAAKKEIGNPGEGIADRERNADGTFAKAAASAPNGPSALNISGFETDDVLQSPEVNRARRECLKYFTPSGEPKISPLEDQRFRDLLIAASPSGFASGTLISSVHAKFVTAQQSKFARSATTEQLVALDVDSFKALTTAQKRVIIERIGSEGWGQLLNERRKQAADANLSYTKGTILEGLDPWTAFHRARGLSLEVAKKLGEQDKKRRYRLPTR